MYPKEPPHRDGSSDHPKQMFKLIDKKILTIQCPNFFYLEAFEFQKYKGMFSASLASPWYIQ